MDKEILFQRAQTMIISSTKKPKHMVISTVKMADLFGASLKEIDQGLNELVKEGRLKQTKMKEPPYHEVYFLS
ncbi:hypothetical protein NLX67_13575 [Domibacillus sp. A3M-37]|uniref:hypothetical protein n=1 Tax=Domibacillus TaxID=1433999 RepID=UPI000617AF4C|nr:MULTISPECIES: hypothetical protein [Domibacillus]MCP3763413.1 hypothetical protein [Domibacillus sp. A3M-37]